MTPFLRPMTAEEAAVFADNVLEPYIAGRIASGEDPDVARRTAVAQMEVLFPGGVPAPGQLVYRVIDEAGTDAGSLWIGPHTPDRPAAFWVWDVAIDESQRGKGLGRAAMLMAEEEARSHGATELGLNVFGYNAVARRLYESLGYETTAVNMRKSLGLPRS